MKNIVVTGGAGFIGSNLVRHMVNKYRNYNIINVDCLTYAGNLLNLVDIVDAPNYFFENVDITDFQSLKHVFEKHQIDGIIHLAAESHVDRSIQNPAKFVQTNVIGTFNLLELVRDHHENGLNCRFHHVSTDEVYGSLGDDGYFTETTRYSPNSPYSASKASSDHFNRAYISTYGINAVITNCSNNYGPYQFPEKLIPLTISNIISGKNIPIYGDGLNVRDWLYVIDHCEAIDTVFHKGNKGETYNIGGHNEWTNIDIVNLICEIMDEKLNLLQDKTSRNLIKFVNDRAGHDRRYAIDASKIQNKLGWVPRWSFEDGIETTINWYLSNKDWIENIKSGQYIQYNEKITGIN